LCESACVTGTRIDPGPSDILKAFTAIIRIAITGDPSMDPNSVPARDGPNPAESPTRTPTGTEDLSDDAAEAEDQAFEDSLFDALLADEPAPRSWAGRSWSIALVPLGLAAAAYAVSRYLKKLGASKKA
jgi:hypothetical protein